MGRARSAGGIGGAVVMLGLLVVGMVLVVVIYAGPIAGLVWGGWQLLRWRKLNQPALSSAQPAEQTSAWQTYQDRPAPEVSDGPEDVMSPAPATSVPPPPAPDAHPVLATLAIVLSLLVMIFVWPYMAEQQTKDNSAPAVTSYVQTGHSGR